MFWRNHIRVLIIAQLRQGVTPQKIALTVALGLSLGIFPILGATTVLCGIVGIWLKLNQPVIQMVNWLVYPLQLSLILVFIRIGEWIVRAPRVAFSLPELIQKFHESPVKFFQQFGMAGVHGIVAWLIVAPFLTLATYVGLLMLLKKFTPSNASANVYVK